MQLYDMLMYLDLDFLEYMFLVSYFNIVLITQCSFWLACNYSLKNYVSNYLSIHKSSVATCTVQYFITFTFVML